MENPRNVIAAGLVLAVLVLVFWAPTAVEYEFEWNDLLNRLGLLVFVALLLERTMEVFLSTWRGAEAARMDTELQKLARRVAALKEGDAKTESLTEEHEQVRAERTEHRSGTQKRAMTWGLISGLLVSLVSVRILEPLTADDAVANLSGFQRFAFHMVDVLLTGGTIAGGSDGIHKLTRSLTVFLDETANKRKEGG